MKVNIKK